MTVITPLTHDDPVAVGGHTLVGRLGSGGMGTVYLARTASGRTVALKTVHEELAREPQFRTRFRLEAEAARSIGSAHGAQVVDCDPDGAQPWLATEYLLGPSLDDALQLLQAPLPETTVRAVGARLAESLAVIHRAGIVHRDLKPSNILLTASGTRIIDFGIARALGANRLTSTGQAVGTPQFMSPEQAGGIEHDGAGDVFALGSVLVCAATGWPPFGTDSAAEILYNIRHREPAFATDLPADLHAALLACLAKNPADRPRPAELSARLGGTSAAFGDVLPAPVLTEIGRRTSEVWTARTSRLPAPSTSTSVTVVDKSPQHPSRRRLFALGGTALGAAVLGGAGWYAYASRSDRKPPSPTVGGPAKRPPGTPPAALWTATHGVEFPVTGLPVVAGGVLAVLDRFTHRITALDAKTGAVRWRRGSFTLIANGGKGGRILATKRLDTLTDPAPGPLSALAPGDGSRTVLGPLGKPPLDPVLLLTATDDTLYLADKGLRTLAAFSATDGRRLWLHRSAEPDYVPPEFEHEKDTPPPAHFAGGRLAVVRGTSVHLHAADTGRPLHRIDTGNAPAPGRPPSTADAERVYTSGSQGLVAVDASTGEVAWRRREPGWNLGGAQAADGSLYVLAETPPSTSTTDPGHLFVYDAKTGAPAWDCEVPLEVNLLGTRPVVRGSRVYLAGYNTTAVVAVDTRTHQPAWTYATTDQATNRLLTADDTHLYILSGTTVTALPLDPTS